MCTCVRDTNALDIDPRAHGVMDGDAEVERAACFCIRYAN